MRTIAALALAFAAATPASASMFDCDHTAPRSAALPLDGATRISIIARAGDLKVTGMRGAAEVRATGTACSSDKDDLSSVTLNARRSGSEIIIEAIVPQANGGLLPWGGHNALDFSVTVPDNVPLRIDDSSGSLQVRNVSGALKIDDTSGSIAVEHVGGNVTIHDTSGSIEVDDVGSLDIPSDSSGSVEIRHVKRDVMIGSKGSGGISVSDVGGNLTVREKGSGHIEVEGVRGRVDVPRRDRD